jgi:hypothetical protein
MANKHKAITQPNKTDVGIFKPERYRLNDAALDFGIKEAKRIKDWPALEKAVDMKIAEMQKFAAWWKANVAQRGPTKKIKKHE